MAFERRFSASAEYSEIRYGHAASNLRARPRVAAGSNLDRGQECLTTVSPMIEF